MKVLLTGCTAQQSSQKLSHRLPTFQSLLFNTLISSGHDVLWDYPSMRWDESYLSQFDSVVVGLSSPTSVSSHRLYGALSTIEKARKVTKVKFLLDSPEPHKVWYGIKAIIDNPNNLIKDFYSNRSEYSTAIQQSQELHSTLESLYSNKWENTLVPSFPWFSSEHITQYIPMLDEQTIKPLCLDSILLTALPSGLFMKSNSNFWSYDSYTPWVKKIEKTIINEAKPMVSSKWSTNAQTLANLNKSIGSLISTYKNNTPWWSINLSQSLFVNTPVITDWRHTQQLGSEWSVLAQHLEEFSPEERSKLAFSQKESYIKQIPNFEDATSSVLSSIF